MPISTNKNGKRTLLWGALAVIGVAAIAWQATRTYYHVTPFVYTQGNRISFGTAKYYHTVDGDLPMPLNDVEIEWYPEIPPNSQQKSHIGSGYSALLDCYVDRVITATRIGPFFIMHNESEIFTNTPMERKRRGKK
jgi:hypothetical protein